MLKEITLLTTDEFDKFKNIIPGIAGWWWLKTVNAKPDNEVFIVNSLGRIDLSFCFSRYGGVRPVCVFELEAADSAFWCKPDKLIGTKIEYRKFDWIILGVENGELRVLCNSFFARRCFDSETNVWENSELKNWLESEGLKIIAP